MRERSESSERNPLWLPGCGWRSVEDDLVLALHAESERRRQEERCGVSLWLPAPPPAAPRSDEDERPETSHVVTFEL